MRITPATAVFAEPLLAFELENRAHFEQWIASRGDAFYNMAAVTASLEQAQWASLAKHEYHYLAWIDDEIVGRLALRNVETNLYHKASLGYRFSARHGGKGYATQAVNHILEFAFKELRLHRIEALVIAGNLPSAAIMRKCGFQQFGHSHSSVLNKGVWMDMLHFEKLADDLPA